MPGLFRFGADRRGKWRMARLVNIRALNRSAAIRVLDSSGSWVKLSPDVDTTVDLDRPDNARALAHHAAIGQWIVAPSAGASGNVFSVKDFGAVGDGTTDDTDALAQATATAGPTDTLAWPAGTYITSEPVIWDSTWVCAGTGSTTLKAKGGSTMDAVVKTRDFDTLTGTATIDGTPLHLGINGITIDGNLVAGVTGMKIYAAGYRVNGLRVRDCLGGGVYSEWGDGGAIGMEAHWNDWRIEECAGIGLDWQGPHDSAFVLGKVWSLSRHLDTAIKVSGHAIGEYFIATHTWGSLDVGYRIERQSYYSMCVAEGAKIANVQAIANDGQWLGGQVYGTNGQAATGNQNEMGFQIGETGWPVGTNGWTIEATVQSFTAGGFPVDYQQSWGNNRIFLNLRGGGGLTWPYTGTPAADDSFQSIAGDQPAMSLRIDPKPFNGLAPLSKAGAPTAADLPAGTFQVFKDTSGGGVVLAYNDGGTLKTVALS